MKEVPPATKKGIKTKFEVWGRKEKPRVCKGTGLDKKGIAGDQEPGRELIEKKINRKGGCVFQVPERGGKTSKQVKVADAVPYGTVCTHSNGAGKKKKQGFQRE